MSEESIAGVVFCILFIGFAVGLFSLSRAEGREESELKEFWNRMRNVP